MKGGGEGVGAGLRVRVRVKVRVESEGEGEGRGCRARVKGESEGVGAGLRVRVSAGGEAHLPRGGGLETVPTVGTPREVCISPCVAPARCARCASACCCLGRDSKAGCSERGEGAGKERGEERLSE